jgi:acetyltransferase-like isoleucine patch superfamily enzyme
MEVIVINKVLRIYRKRQYNNIVKEFHRRATVGEMTRIGGNAAAYNESGDRSKIIVGHHCTIDGFLFCKSSARIEIGNYSWLGDRAKIECLNHVKVGHYVGIGDGTLLVDNSGHPTEPEERVKHRIRVAPGGPGYPGLGDGCELSDSAPIIIEDVVWIGANCLILKGVTISEGSIVARNSVVTKDVPPYTIVAGFPAKVVKELKKPNYKYYEV